MFTSNVMITQNGMLETLKSQFELPLVTIESVGATSFHTHFIGTAGLRQFHIKVYAEQNIVQNPYSPETIIEVETKLTGTTSQLVRSAYRSFYGTYTVKSEYGTISVRRHRGVCCCPHEDALPLFRAALQHCDMLQKNKLLIPAETDQLRFMSPFRALKAMERHIGTYIQRVVGTSIADTLREHLNTISDVLGQAGSADTLVLCHGDLTTDNMVSIGKAINVIDHDCLHYSLPLFDLAHLAVQRFCTGYFAGRLSPKISDLSVFPEPIRMGNGPRLFYSTCIFVMLKKLCLVAQPQNLFIADRVAILQELRGLANASRS